MQSTIGERRKKENCKAQRVMGKANRSADTAFENLLHMLHFFPKRRTSGSGEHTLADLLCSHKQKSASFPQSRAHAQSLSSPARSCAFLVHSPYGLVHNSPASRHALSVHSLTPDWTESCLRKLEELKKKVYCSLASLALPNVDHVPRGVGTLVPHV